MIIRDILFLICLCASTCSSLDSGEVIVVILSQENAFHNQLAHRLKNEILEQAASLKNQPTVKIVPDDFPSIGSWTVIPLIPKLISLGGNSSWVFFCEDRTHVNIRFLLEGLGNYDKKQEQWVGYGLYDLEPSIIHHFAFADAPKKFKYPLFSSGFAMTTTLLKRLQAKAMETADNPSEFSIDASHELALFVGTPLTHDPDLFCLNRSPSCASFPEPQLSCGDPVPIENIFFAVKTCHKFHNDRVPVVKKTWGKEAKYMQFFSDLQNDSIPTTYVGIENTERGHCQKSLKILQLVLNEMKEIKTIKWVLLSDDDTILSVPRLLSLLACFKNNSVIGERYGYNVRYKSGYNYITGGGGIVIGSEILPVIVESCHCPTIDTPDDMFLGLCLHRLGVHVTHSPFFHQARPADYAVGYLESQYPISFHKHWMVDPVNVYNKWFSQQKDHSISHNEL